MFPEFPTLRHDLAKQLHTLFEQMVEAKAPLFAKIPIVSQHEGTMHSYDRIGADSKTEGQEQIAIPITFNVDEVPELVGDKLLAKLDGLADGSIGPLDKGLTNVSVIPALTAGSAIALRGIQYHSHIPYVQGMNFAVQAQLSPSIYYTISYVGTLARHLESNIGTIAQPRSCLPMCP